MPITITSREFNQDRSKALKAAQREPVYITNRGKPVYVLSTVEQFEQRPAVTPRSLLDVVAMAGGQGIEFEPGRIVLDVRPAELD